MGRRHDSPRESSGPGRWVHGLPTALVLVVLIAAVGGWWFDLGPRWLGWKGGDPDTDPAAVSPPVGLSLPEWGVPAPVVVPEPALRAGDVDPARVRRALAEGLRDRDLGRHVVAAVGNLSGRGEDWSSAGEVFTPASTTKILTAAAALEALGPDHRFTTRVVTGDRPRDVVLVGGGDPYLGSEPVDPPDREAVYPDRADLVTLARRTARALADGPVRVRLAYDDSLFTGPTDNPRWRRDYVRDGIVSPITALWADQGRSPGGTGRVADPSRSAATVFAEALRKAGVRVVGEPRAGLAPRDGVELAAVESAPLAQVVERVLDVSDNEAAEVLAHHVGVVVEQDGSFAGGARGVVRVLGIADGPDRIFDGSGLSRHNRVSTDTLLEVLRRAALPDEDDLRAVLTGLPVAGFTGSLAYRFDEGAPQGPGRVRAKTGTLTGVHALAGVVTDRDGNELVFVIAADRVRLADNLDAREAIDRLAADLAACRCSAR